jgi:kynureninase
VPPLTRADCVRLDASGPLTAFRHEFTLPPGVLYLDGNSLGPLPVGAAARAAAVVEQEWGQGLIRSWNGAGWFDLPRRLGDKLSALIGGGDGQTVVTDTTSTNLFKVLAAACRISSEDDPARKVIVSERDTFPTDLYIAEGLIELIGDGWQLRLVDRADGLAAALGPDVGVVLLSHVNYRTGALWDLPGTTALVQRHGALAVWDLAHSVGALPIGLSAADADFAVGCTYKYLNGGPGAPAFVWVHERHHDRFRQPLAGWWGHARPFAMEAAYEPAPGIGRYLCGTQPVVSLALVECGLDIALRADPAQVRRTSLSLGDTFLTLVEQRCAGHPLRLVTPMEHARRGSHLSFAHPDGFAVMSALIERGVIGDYREPEVLRFALTPLYLSHADVWDAVAVLADVLDTGAYDHPGHRSRTAVT